MASVMAIVSKAVFEKQAKGAAVGTVVELDGYASSHAALAPLADGGSLFMVTVRPPDERMWLVSVLEHPTLGEGGWHATANKVAICDITALKSKLVFASGKGMKAAKGALGMSLQTPRALTPADEKLLRAACGGGDSATKVAPTPASPAPSKAPALKTTKAASSGAPPLTGTGLARVKDALAQDDGAAALDAALAWWRETRAPAVATLVETISKQVSRPPALTEREWSKLATAKNPLDLGSLLGAIPELPVSFLPSAAELLAAFPDDPRIAAAVARWALDPVTTSSATYPFWTKMLDALARSRDVRALPLLQKRLKKPQEKSQFWPKFYAALERVVATLKAEPVSDVEAFDLASRVSKLSPVGPSKKAPNAEKTTAPELTGPLLAQAAAHVAAGRFVQAIDAMLVCWREARAPELADCIDRATRLLPSYDRPLATSAKQSHSPWMAACSTDPMATMPQLLQNLNVGGPAFAERRLVELGNLPDDPRVALRLAEVSAFFGISPERTQYWKTLFELIARIGDVRTCAPLRTTFSDFTGTYYNHHRQARRIVGNFAMNPPPPTALPAPERGRLTKLEEALNAAERKDSMERDLIAAIAANWDDDGPRQVYADWLIERGHPRGELIALECLKGRSDAQDKRLEEILQIPYLNGPLEDLAQDKGSARDRGLVRTIATEWSVGPLTWHAVATYPLLALVKTLRFGDATRHLPTPDDFARVLAAASSLEIVEKLSNDALAVAALALVKGKFRREGAKLLRLR